MADINQDVIADLLSEDELPYVSIRIVGAINKDGNQTWHGSIQGDTRISGVVGLLEMFKHWALTEGQ